MRQHAGLRRRGRNYRLACKRLPASRAAAIQEYIVEHYTDGHGDDAREVKRSSFKLSDKLRALELLGKHHALFTERHVHELGTAERLAAALERIGEPANDSCGRIAADVRVRAKLDA